MKALVVRPSSIGDVVHALPVLAALRRAGWQTGWLCEPPAMPLLEGGGVGVCVASPSRRGFRSRAALRALSALRRERFDAALELAGLWKTAAWARLSAAKRVIGYGARFRREPTSAWLLSERVDRSRDAPHVIDKNLALLRALGIEAVGLREFPLPPLDAAEATVSSWLAAEGLGEFVLLNPCGGWAGKLWPAESYGRLARRLNERGLPCVVTWGPGEQHVAERVVSIAGEAARSAPPTALLEYVALARRARLVVAADTGPLHLACAVGTPVVGLYGPTDPLRNGPFAKADLVVRRLPPCAPCYSRRCSFHDGVMDAIETQEVLEAVDRRLGAA